MTTEAAARLDAIRPALREAAERFGTPLYVTDLAVLHALAAELEDAFGDGWLRLYSLKANPLPALVRELVPRGWLANVVSLGEWAAARRAGMPNAAIALEGIGKSDQELRAAVAAAARGEPLQWVTLESSDEAARLAELWRGAHRASTMDVLLRLNPEVEPETHRGLAVGTHESKFGMHAEELQTLIASETLRASGLHVRGVHVHVGSQLGDVAAWGAGARAALAILTELAEQRPEADTLDVGGGFPAGLTDGPAPARFRAAFDAVCAGPPSPTRRAIEPGRRVVAAAGWIVASVLHVRERGTPQVVLDAGMTELMRPALYGARHGIHVLRANASESTALTQVHGPVCEAADALGDHELPALARGDLVAIDNAGAYAASQQSEYNGRPLAPQVLLGRGGELVLAQSRRRSDVAILRLDKGRRKLLPSTGPHLPPSEIGGRGEVDGSLE
jgi:diaminopimelate decarboxylase